MDDDDESDESVDGDVVIAESNSDSGVAGVPTVLGVLTERSDEDAERVMMAAVVDASGSMPNSTRSSSSRCCCCCWFTFLVVFNNGLIMCVCW